MFAANHMGVVTQVTDPYFGNVTLLLHGEGSNGSTTITDSSGTPATITANGNSQISTAWFDQGSASIKGDGTGDRLSFAGDTARAINGTGDFTLEWSVYYTALPTGAANQGCAWYAQDSGAAVVSPFNLIQRGNIWYLYADTGAGTWNIFSNTTIATTSLTTGVKYKMCLERAGSTFTLYVDGTSVGTASSSASIQSTAARNFYLFGAWQSPSGTHGLNGYVDEYRLTKGVARYNGNYTPSTTPFPDA